ncbi:MAG TPA: 16S rRNA (cytidine(1402)-2'-O)-methyltransferase [Gammaproteobacteria bacterium]|jgi:16S rRNA (cytidine1402-2'-O)-methyltransferase|nr:16S rRNA (cytidine(1402)-2'-O)-methyltransferase [Gammaproteobacteria bacterium]
MKNDGLSTLYVVATPIGNLDDLSQRAIAVLQQVDKIAAEDTRHSASLLKHYLIKKPMLSLHNFNERERVSAILEALAAGESIALISDAGTPLISDPGYHLVRAVRAAHFKVVPIPGACAAIAALSAAGLPTDKFIFEGFLPAKTEAKRQQLLGLVKEPRTLVFYEAPHRLLPTLQTMVEVFSGEREVVVARELTKLYESILQLPLNDMLAYYEAHPEQCKGEVVIMLAGAKEAATDQAALERILTVLLANLPLKQAASVAAELTGERKNEVYAFALRLKQG